jgi:hypothetical protein
LRLRQFDDSIQNMLVGVGCARRVKCGTLAEDGLRSYGHNHVPHFECVWRAA